MIAAVFCSCKKQTDGLGQNLLPGSDEIYVQSNDTTPLLVSSYLLNRAVIQTDQFVCNNVLVGNYNDQTFGSTSARAYLQLDKSIPCTFTENSLADSLVLTLVCRDSVQGDLAAVSYSLQPLAARLLRSTSYYADDVVAVRPENLIESGFETGRLQKITAGYLLKLRLSLEYASLLMRQAQQAENGEFFFLDEAGSFALSSNGSNFIVSIDMEHDLTQMVVHYRDSDPDNGTLSQPKSYNFGFNDNCEAFTHLAYSAQGSALEGISETSSVPAQQTANLQSGASTYLKVDLSSIDWLLASGTPTINSARLIVPFDTNKYGDIDMIIAHDSINDAGLQSLQSFGKIKNGLGYYEIYLTSYLQSYLKGELNDAVIYLSARKEEVEFGGDYSYVRQTKLHGPEFSPVQAQNMRLAITYTFD
ncbi:MAG: DUF4270 family protein [Flavobacteriales bacterium]